MFKISKGVTDLIPCIEYRVFLYGPSAKEVDSLQVIALQFFDRPSLRDRRFRWTDRTNDIMKISHMEQETAEFRVFRSRKALCKKALLQSVWVISG
jgi:hypothetical protein